MAWLQVTWCEWAVSVGSVHSPAHVGELGGISVSRETDGQASGGSDSGDWIFTIREKDPKNLENGTLQPSDLERNKV